MPVEFQLEAMGVMQVSRTFMRLSERAESTGPLFAQMTKDLRLVEQVQFLTEGHGKWAALQESTLKRKAQMGQPLSILRATQALYRSLTEQSAGSIAEHSKTFLRFGSDLKQGGFHMTGTRYMPARKPMDLTEVERRALGKMVQRFLVSGEVGAMV